MGQCGLHFSCGGVNMDDSHSEQLMSFKHRMSLTEEDKKALTENDVHSFGDLTEVVNDQVKSVDLRRIKATFLSNLIAGKTPRQTALHLRQGTCWLILSEDDAIVYEYIGHIQRDEQWKVMVRKWVTINKGDSIEEGDIIRLCPSSVSRGTGTDIIL